MPSSASYRSSIKDTAVLVSLCLIIGGVDGYLTGAPHSRCGNMQPGHGSEGSNNPYSLEVMGKAGGYHPGKVLRVKVVGGGGYQGILLKAIKAGGAIDDENRGLFEDPVDHTRLGQCTWANDYITHNDNDLKDDTVIYRWRSKADQGTSSIQFVATILPGKNTYYMSVLSEEIPHSDTVEEEAPSSDPDDDEDDDDDDDDGLEDIVTHPHSMGAADCRVNGILVLLVSTLMLFLRQR